MFKRIATGILASALALVVTAPVQAQVILMNDSTSDTVQVLDRMTGDLITTFDASYASTGIAVIDGPGDTLLMSDQVGDTIHQMDSHGALIGTFISAPIDNLRGINMLPNGFVVGASASGIYAWDTNGNILTQNIPGDFFDVLYVQNRLIGTSLGNNNVAAFNLMGGLLGQIPTGSIAFPEQCARVQTSNGPRIAVVGFTAQNVTFITPGGSIESSFPITGSGRGIIQAGNGNLLVSSNSGLYEYTLSGTLVRTIMTGGGFRYLHVSNNYTP